MEKDAPITPSEARDMHRNVTAALDRCKQKLDGYSDFYNSTSELRRSFESQVGVLKQVVQSLIWMVFISMVLNLATVGVLLYVWLKGR